MTSPVFDSAANAGATYGPQAYRQLLARLNDAARATAQTLGLDWDEVMRPDSDVHSPARQALVLLQLGLFDQDYYLAQYPDVASTAFHPLLHYVKLGDAEGRRPNAAFDPFFYRTQFDHGEPHSVGALYHYAVFGEPLGLRASGSFSPRRYLQSNAELQPWLDHPLTHYLQLGRKAGLTPTRRERLTGAQKVPFEQPAGPKRPARVSAERGVNIIGPLDRVSGLGVSARGYLDGLRRAQLPRIGCRAQQREFGIQSSIEGTPAFPAYLSDAEVNLVHMNGDTLPALLAHGGEELLKDKYNIAIWYWELPTLRPEWQATMRHFHEFWAPTPFIQRALERSTAKPVHLLPPYLAYLEDLKRPAESERAETGFVYCFDANSILERKNPGALLDAFLLAFPKTSHPGVRLTFKITYPNRKLPEVDRLYRSGAADDRITIIDRMLSDAELHRLIGSASAYVSPHRSEGLGLTVVEAMGSGVPVISTPFGGVDAFVDSSTAFLPDIRLTELEADYAPYPQGFVWADPDMPSLAHQLSAVHSNPGEAARKADQARRRVLDYFCSDRLVARYAELLRTLGEN